MSIDNARFAVVRGVFENTPLSHRPTRDPKFARGRASSGPFCVGRAGGWHLRGDFMGIAWGRLGYKGSFFRAWTWQNVWGLKQDMSKSKCVGITNIHQNGWELRGDCVGTKNNNIHFVWGWCGAPHTRFCQVGSSPHNPHARFSQWGLCGADLRGWVRQG